VELKHWDSAINLDLIQWAGLVFDPVVGLGIIQISHHLNLSQILQPATSLLDDDDKKAMVAHK
jgi:hypothetical protein